MESRQDKFNECQTSYGMSVTVSKEIEKEQQGLSQQEPHVEEDKERPRSQANTKPMVETDAEKPIEPKQMMGTLTTTQIPCQFPPHDPAPHKEPCDQATRKPDTPVGSVAQLSNTGRLAPDGLGPKDREVRLNKEQESGSLSWSPWCSTSGWASS